VDVKGIRKKTGLTQPAFSAKFGFSLGTVRDWEQRRYEPKGSDRAFLTVIDRDPKAVLKALSA
jgi:putative transcriptional regulator